MIARTLREYLESHGARFRVHLHEPGPTAAAAAAAAHVPRERFAKSVLLRAHTRPPGRLILVVVPADQEIDLANLSQALGFSVDLAGELAWPTVFPDFALGAAPPIGELAIQHLPVFVDASLSQLESIAFHGGTSSAIVEMPWTEYARVARHKLVDCGRPRGAHAPAH